MKTYIINLPHDKERLSSITKRLAGLGFDFEVIEAVDGSKLELPHPAYSETGYHLRHGKKTNPAELGCYFSHIKALEKFLATKDSLAMIVEDDVQLFHDLPQIIGLTLKLSDQWDILRLSGYHSGLPLKIARLTNQHYLCCNLGRQTGAGAYLINKKAATRMVKQLLPMKLPYDHAFDQEWLLGIKALFVKPLPTSQYSHFTSNIWHATNDRVPLIHRIPAFLYRFTNELTRVMFRSLQLVQLKSSRKGKPGAA